MRCLAPILLGVSLAAVSAPAAAQTADLAVTQTASPGKVAADTDLTYAIVVTSRGPNAASATLDDVLPPGVRFVSFTAPAGWQKSTPEVGGGGSVTATRPTMARGETATFTLVVHVDPAPRAGPPVCNTATVASKTADPNRGNNSVSTATPVTGSDADLAVTKTAAPRRRTALSRTRSPSRTAARTVQPTQP